MPVPESYRRYGGREDSSSSYATYSSTRTTPSNRSSYLYNQKLTSTLPPRPSYERKSSETGMPVSRFLNSSASTSIPRSSANYISTTSSSRTLSPIPTSVTSYRRTFEGVPSVTDRIKSLEIGGLEKDLFSNGTTSRFLSKVRERNQERDRETSVKPLSSYSSRDRSGSGEFRSPLSGSSMILRERGGSEMHRPTGDYSNRFDPKLRAASVMGRATSPTPSTTSTSSNRRNGYSRLGSSEVTPTSSTDTTTTTTTPANSSSSKSVPIVVAAVASNNATAKSVENGVTNLKDDVECDVENHNGSCNGVFSPSAAAAYPASTNSSTSLPPIVNGHKNEQNGATGIVPRAKLGYNSRSNSLTNQNDVSSAHGENKPQVDQAMKQSPGTTTATRAGSTSPEKDSNGNTIIPVKLIRKKGAIAAAEDKMAASVGERLLGSPPRNANSESKNTCNGVDRTIHVNGNYAPKSAARRSPEQVNASATAPKVIFHAIKLEDHGKNESTESQPVPKNTPKPQARKLSDTHFKNIQHSNDGRTNGLDYQSTNQNGEESRARETSPLLSVAKSSSGSTKILPANQDKAKQLTRSSRSPSPATSSSSSSSASSPHLPSITKISNGESQDVNEMGGPHCSKHQNGGGAAGTNGDNTRFGSPKLDSGSPSSRAGGRDNDSPGSSTRPRIRFNNSSDSSDNDSDASSPNVGRYRSSREKEKGLSGLRNIGNTCFMNSVIQCLSNTKPLLEYLIDNGYASDISTSSNQRGALIRAFASVIQELWNDSKSVVDTSAFKDQIQRFAPRFMGYSQQDAQEFLRYLLEGLHEDVNRVTVKPAAITTEIDDSLSDSQKASEAWKRYLRFDDSKIVDLFVGQFKSTLKCTSCGHCSVTFDPFWDLSLPIPSKAGQTRLSQCLELFTREEILDGDEKPTCSKCQTRRRCTKSLSIQKFPKVLVIHLKRFSPMERYRGKLNTTVDFPMTGLDMSPYAAIKGQGATYNLYGVSNHSGSTYSGHYIAYCKHPYSGEWYCYNDSRVSSMSTHSVVSSDGYVLFYELASQSSHL